LVPSNWIRFDLPATPTGSPRSREPAQHRQLPRNRRIAETLFRCGIVERAGQGADRIVEACIRNGQTLPDYQHSDAYQVSLTLDGELRNAALLRVLDRIDPTVAAQLDVHDLLVFRMAALGSSIPKELRPRAAQLLDVGLLQRGRGGKYMPARAYSEGTTGFLDVRPRDLIAQKLLAFLHEHAADGRSMEELIVYTPNASRSTIKRVLNELQQRGKAHSVGSRSQTRWFPGPVSFGSAYPKMAAGMDQANHDRNGAT
jgi:ATP-dependent DNA helicase RecG